MSSLSKQMQALALAADKKLTKNSPSEAKFHRGMREHHKECARDCKAEGDKEGYRMHKAYIDHHNKLYKQAMR